MSKIKDIMNNQLKAAMSHLDDDNGIFNGFSLGNNFDLLCSEVSLTMRQSQERDADFIQAYQLSVLVRQSDFDGDANTFEGDIAIYKDIERRVMKVTATSDGLEWRFDLGAKYTGR